MKVVISALVALICLVTDGHGFMVLRGENQSDFTTLRQTDFSTLLSMAAKSGEKITVPLLEGNQTVIAQNGVNILIDCNSLVPTSGKPLAAIEWNIMHFFLSDGKMIPQKSGIRPLSGVKTRISTKGEFNRYLNITQSNALQASHDPDTGLYTCTSCTSSGCRSATLMLLLIGNKFKLIQGEPDALPTKTELTEKSYDVGTDFCVEADSNDRILLRCAVVPDSPKGEVIPIPVRTWRLNDTLVYTKRDGEITDGSLSGDFITDSVLRAGVVEPQPFFVVSNGAFFMDFTARTLVQPLLAPSSSVETVKRDVFNALMGTWTCTVSTPHQTMTASTIISQC